MAVFNRVIKRTSLVALMAIVFACSSVFVGVQQTGVYGAVGDVFTAKIDIGGEQVDCTFKVTGANTCMLGTGEESAWATEDQKSFRAGTFSGYNRWVYFHPALPGVRTTADYSDETYSAGKGRVIVPQTVSNGGTTYNVTAIGAGAFFEAYGITEVQLPRGIESIGAAAFAECYGLKTISIPNTCLEIGDYAFANDSAFRGWSGAAGVKSIGNAAFYECSAISGLLELPVNLETLGASAFSHCTGITELRMNNRLTSSGPGAFYSDYALGKVTLSNGLKVIPRYMFSRCTSLNTVSNTSQLTGLEEGCFGYCLGLEVFNIPGGVEEIGASAFEKSGLRTVYIPSTLKKVGVMCFLNNQHLETVSLPSSGNVELDDGAFNGCTALERVTLSAGVKKLGTDVFYKCTALQEVEFSTSAGVTEIPDGTFRGCSALTDIQIPSYVQSIGDYVFYDCSALNRIELPASVASIGRNTQNTFGNASGLKALVLNRSSVVSMGSFYYSDATNFEKGLAYVYVPDSLVAAYKAADTWSTIADCIKPMSQLPSDTNVYALLKSDGTLVEANAGGNAVSGGKRYTTAAQTGDYSTPAENKTINKVFIASNATSIPEGTFAGCTAIAEVNIPASVTQIDRGAFSECNGLTRARGGSNVRTVGDVAFEECYALRDANFLDSPQASVGNGAFQECLNLRTAKLATDTVQIGNSAFDGCKMLSTVVLPTKTNGRIGEAAFRNCTALASIRFASSYWEIGAEAFCNTGFVEVTMPAYVANGECGGTAIFRDCQQLRKATVLGSYRGVPKAAFKGCTALTDIEFSGSGLEVILDEAFMDCTALASVDLPDSVEAIGCGSFGKCGALKEVNLPDNLTRIDSTFRGCKALSSVKLPASLEMANAENLGTRYEGAFANCRGLESLDMSDCTSLEYLGSGTCVGCFALSEVKMPEAGIKDIRRFVFQDCYSLGSITLPESLQTLGEAAFANCVNLKEVELGKHVEALNNQAFFFCTALEEIELPASLETIGKQTFMFCNSLEEITIPKNVKGIGMAALNHCDKLKTVIFENDCSEYTEGSNYNWVSGTEFDSPYRGGDAYDSEAYSDSGYANYWLMGNDNALEKVIFRDKKPSGGVVFQYSRIPEVYYTLTYYASAQDAAKRLNPQDRVTVKAGTAVSKTAAPAAANIYDGTYHRIGTTEANAKLSPLDNSYWVLPASPLPQVISSVEATASNTEPKFDATIRTPAVTITAGSPATASAVWQKYNPSTDSWSTASGKFEDGVQYRISIELSLPAGSNASFADGLSFKLNDEILAADESGKYVTAPITVRDTTPKTLAEMTLTPDSFTYDGKEHSPAVSVKNNRGETLVEGTDYTLGGYTSGDAQGSYTIYAYGKGIYSGQQISAQWSITSGSAGATITSWVITPASADYTGDTIYVKVTLKDSKGKTLVENRDFYVTGTTGATEPGTYKVTVYGVGDYAGQSKTLEWEIKEPAVSTPELKAIKLTPGNADYTGEVIEQSITVTNTRGETLTEGSDYVVSGTLSATEPGSYTIEVKGIGDYDGQSLKANWRITKASEGTFFRYWGNNRYETSLEIAKAYKEKTGAESLDAIIVAYGGNFPDALAGGYLAKVEDAPLVTMDKAHEASVLAYIKSNVKAGGKVYILGGTGVVSQSFEDKANDQGFDVERLGGMNRYETNMKILKAAGVDDEDIMVCSGNGFADSLSGSAVGKPILVVNTDISADQSAYLDSLNTSHYYIIGGTGAVNAKIETKLQNKYGKEKVERVWGATRYDTSIAVAEKFFPDTVDTVTLTYGKNFPDGLSGGPLAITLDAPLILTEPNSYKPARDYVRKCGAYNVVVYGGAALIPDKTVFAIMGRTY